MQSAEYRSPARSRATQRGLPRGSRRLILALVLLLAVFAGPARSVNSVLGSFDRTLGFLPAFSAEPTVTVGLGRPADGAHVGRFVSVEATAMADAGLASVRCLADGTLVDEVVPASVPTALHYAFTWDSVGAAEGTGTVSVVARDVAGRTATATAGIVIDHSVPRLTYSPAPSLWAFSPNRDKIQDVLTVSVRSSEPVALDVAVGSGPRRRSLLTSSVPRYTSSFTWDGRLPGPTGLTAVADGTYPLSVQAADLAGNTAGGTLYAIVDRAGPVARWISVSPRAFRPAKRGRGTATVSAIESSGRLIAQVDVLNAAGIVIRQLKTGPRPIGSVSLAWDGRYRPGGKIVPPGEFNLRPVLRDIAGNKTVLPARYVRVHASRPPVTIFRVATRQKLIALTFDDLYGVARTRRILAILAANRVKATFFAAGQAAAANPGLMRDIVAGGHVLGDHSWNHPQLTKLNAAGVRSQLLSCDAAVMKATGLTTSPWFRPPYGSSNAMVAAAAASTEHPYVFQWDIDTRDWASPGVSRIVGAVSHGARPGSIVLMHGGPPQTPLALPAIIRTLKARGYRMVTLPELLWIGGYR